MTVNPTAVLYPKPKRERWQPLRCGLLNLFRYDDQQFIFEDGHLLLRGSNGSGKTRVLALTLPFLLDAELDPARMEPDRDRAKRVEWNLLMGKYQDRTGYSWLEFGRRGELGNEYVTLGCGMTAVKGRRLERWFFLTHRRPGRDFSLKNESGLVHNQRRLEEELIPEEVFTTARQYREKVNKSLFKLDEHRYGVLVNLLIELRQPQLARKFDEGKLSDALSEALPPLDDQVIANVAEAFKSLEHDKSELEKLDQVAAATKRFLESYRRYTRVAARRKAELVRKGNSQFEEKSRHRKGNLDETSAKEQRLAEVEKRQLSLEDEERATRTRIDTLKDSPEMRKADELARAAKDAEQARTRESEAEKNLNRANDVHSEMERRKKASQDQVEKDRDQVQTAGSSTKTAAQLALLVPQYELAVGKLDLVEPRDATALQRAQNAIKKHLRERFRDIDHVVELNQELAAAKVNFTKEKQAYTFLSSQLCKAEDDLKKHIRAHASARENLIKNFAQWLTQIVILPRVPLESVLEPLREWCEYVEGESPLERAAKNQRSLILEHHYKIRSELLINKEKETAARDQLEKRCERLREGWHQPPPAPHFRNEEARLERPGAPLWALCDFREPISPGNRPGLEAALEASGLLDAWVLPDGRIEGGEGFDSFLVNHATKPEKEHLGTVLKPSVDPENPRAAQVDPQTVAGLLARIGLGQDEGVVWVDPSGNWQVGPLRGQWQKQETEHIGQGAREIARRRRLVEAEKELALCHEQLKRIEVKLQELEERKTTLDREMKLLPNHQEVRNAITAIGVAQKHRDHLMDEVTAAEEKVAQARKQQEEKRHRRDEEASILGLGERVDNLETLRRDCHDYQTCWDDLRHRLERLAAALAQWDQADDDWQKAKREVNQRQSELERLRQDRVSVTSRYQTLKNSFGKTVHEVRRQLSLAQQKEEQVKREIKRVYETRSRIRTRIAVLDQELAHLEEDMERADERRMAAAKQLQRFAEARLLSIAVPDVYAEPKTTWTITHAVDLARKLESALTTVPAEERVWQNLDGRIHATISELIDELRPHGYDPFQEKVDDIMLVQVPQQGKTHTMAELSHLLEDRIRGHRELLGARERAIIEEHLVGEITQVLHERLIQCRESVTDMNGELASRPTSSGLTLRVKWRLQDDPTEALKKARKLLMQISATWSLEERTALGQFLQRRIEAARQNGEEGGWEDHLRVALDYRRWHRFDFEIKQDDRWGPLNRSSYGQKSGGEKAAALMLLQLAAASSHYRSAHGAAPRLILMDEAFVGVDDKMRAQCMGLLKTFDLDFIMTSEREKGCYETLPGVAICQLSTHPQIDAVHVHRLVWNGKRPLPDEYAGSVHGP